MARQKKAITPDNEPTTMLMGILTNQEFVTLFNSLMHEAMPMVIAYSLLILQDEIKTHHANFETLRQKLIAQYGECDAGGNLLMNEEKTQYMLKDPAGFNREFLELMNLQVPVSKIPLSHLANLKLTPANLKLLMDSIVKK